MEDRDINVSIIIPVYNGARYLENCLKSVMRQTLKEMEVICVDDGSTDDSAVILDRYERQYPEKLTVFHTENQGVWKARELALEKAQGIYVGFVDCDDQIEDDMYEKMFTIAAANRAEMAVTAYQRIVETGGKQKILVEMNTWGKGLWEVGNEFYRFPFLNTALWNKIILRDIALKHIKFERPPRVAEDALFLLSIYPYVHCITFLPEPGYWYYVRGGTAMSCVTIDETDNILKSFGATKKYVYEITDDKRWNSVMEIAAYIHLGVSLLLRCRPEESRQYIKKVKVFLKREFPGRNSYMCCLRDKEFRKVRLVRLMYGTGVIYLIQYLKKYVIRIIKW